MATKQQKLDRMLGLLEQAQQRGGLDEKRLAALKVYADVDLEELRAYLQRQSEAAQQFVPSTEKTVEPEPNPFLRVSELQLRQIIRSEDGIIALGAKLELARRDFFEFCHLLAPRFYKPERAFLVKLCRELQDFYESDELVCLVNLPPRHGKSRTAGLFAMWVYGREQTAKIMTGSYNETLSTTFSKTVRNGIQEGKAERGTIVFSDIFPAVRIKQGDAAMNLWSLDGQYASYLATSPGGTATGFGATLIIIDDLIKAAEEAFNEGLLDGHWKWFTDTMLSRLEEGGKIIIIMTRWASNDLAGKAKAHFTEQGIKVREVVMKAVQDDSSMLCPEILSLDSYRMKTRAMSEEIASANYQQIPIDLKGRLYSSLKIYTILPMDANGRSLFTTIGNYTDTADEGSDFLCSINYGEYQGEAYILDVLYTQDGMEITEPATAKLLDEGGVGMADIESNNGGRGFARNVQTQLKKRGNRRCVVKWFHQSANKKARILTNAGWIMEHIYFPANWRDRWPQFYRDLMKYQKAGKNAHDDAPDALTGVAEHFVKPVRRMKLSKRRYGL